MESALLFRAEAAALDRYPGFSSFKTRSRIHYQQRWIRDALIQSSLDPYCVELAPSTTPVDELPGRAVFAFRRRTQLGFGLVLVTAVETDMDDIIGDDRVTIISRVELSLEPRLTAARAIWTHKRLQVDSAERYRSIEVVSRWGSAAMNEVLKAFRSESVEPVHQLCSMIANSYLNIDLSAPLGPNSILTIGPAFSVHSTTLAPQNNVVGQALG